MARNFGPIRNYAPYLFLSKANSSEYKLFVSIPYEAGKKVEYDSNLTYAYTGTTLSFTISDDVGVASAGKYYKGIALNPADAAKNGGYGFYPSTFTIKVDTKRTVVVGGVSTLIVQTLKLVYDTADENSAVSGDIAPDCPYIYLTNPDGETENGDKKFTPFCLAPLGSYEEDTQSYNESVGGVQGQCLQEINMKSPLPTGKTEINPSNITANTETYTDPAPVNGYFEVILNYPIPAGQSQGPKYKRKGKVSNVNCDPN